MDLHPRSLRSNIWRALLCATDQEITDGMHFYPGAYGLCRLFSKVYGVTIEQVAGIYAALSPMNTWDTNVANIVDVLRDWSAASVNTTDTNLHKALRIRCGADPATVLVGRKVRAFYNCIADPNDWSVAPAIDRHLINLALGIIPTKNEQSRLASNPHIYSKVEAAYLDLGRREGLGNRLASIAWFVQRRVARSGQIAIYHPDSPVCCDRPMHSHGSKRFKCRQCNHTRVKISVPKPLPPKVLIDYPIPYPLSTDRRGRTRVQLGVGHPLANSAGWQYLYRYVVESHLGRKLRTDEHVHHCKGIKTDCRLSELEVWLAERHGRYHARTQLLYMFRDEKGRFVKSEVPTYDQQYIETADRDLDDHSLPFGSDSYPPTRSSAYDDTVPVPF